MIKGGKRSEKQIMDNNVKIIVSKCNTFDVYDSNLFVLRNNKFFFWQYLCLLYKFAVL